MQTMVAESTTDPPGAEALYSTHQVVRMIPALSYRMVDYWDRMDYIHPHTPATGSGSRRVFTALQVEILRVLTTMSRLIGGNTSGSVGLDTVISGVWRTLEAEPELLTKKRLYITPRGDVSSTVPPEGSFYGIDCSGRAK